MKEKQPVYLICGVSGSGKTWVARQLQDKFHYIPHDEHFQDHETVIKKAVETADRPIITEVPFAERVLKEELERSGIKVIPYFVVESPEVCAQRYRQREKKPIQKAAYTRARTILERVREWRAPSGTSEEILKMLRKV